MEDTSNKDELRSIESAPLRKIPQKIFWSGDKLIGISALFVSIVSVSVILYQTHLMQKQQYAAALPYLELWNSGSDTEYRLLLVNNGVGPAFIKKVRVHYQGKIYEGDHINFLGNIIFPKDTTLSKSYIYGNISEGRVIPAGREISLFHIENSPKDAPKYRGLLGGDSAKLELVYSSVYGEEWKLIGVGGISLKTK